MESLLIIEDDEALRELYVRTLRDEGFAVESAEDGKKAIVCWATADTHWSFSI